MQEQFTALEQLMNASIEFGVNYSFQVLGALVVLAIGFLVAGWIAAILLKILQKKNVDITLSNFLVSCAKVLIITFAIIISLGKFGITIAPFVAALGALAFGASFAIAGPLANYGAGLTIIITRPFVVGNTITVADVSGVVQEVKLACTILTNEDGVLITIPNKHIVGEVIENSKENKIVEGVVGISYSNDPKDAIHAIRETLNSFSDVQKTPPAQIGVQEFADSSVNIGFRYWVPTVKFFQTSYVVNQAVFEALAKANITIPFPQRDVHVISEPQTSNRVGTSQLK